MKSKGQNYVACISHCPSPITKNPCKSHGQRKEIDHACGRGAHHLCLSLYIYIAIHLSIYLSIYLSISRSLSHVYLKNVQHMVSGELGRGVCPDTVLLDTVYPLRQQLNNVQRMLFGEYCESVFPETVCWTRLRNT